jgi:hypothetical protein
MTLIRGLSHTIGHSLALVCQDLEHFRKMIFLIRLTAKDTILSFEKRLISTRILSWLIGKGITPNGTRAYMKSGAIETDFFITDIYPFFSFYISANFSERRSSNHFIILDGGCTSLSAPTAS